MSAGSAGDIARLKILRSVEDIMIVLTTFAKKHSYQKFIVWIPYVSGMYG